MDYRVVISAIAAVILFFFGGIFALASVYAPIRLVVAALLFTAGFGILVSVYAITRKPLHITQRIELSGEMKAVAITCPNCGGSIPPEKIKILGGVPFATCGYCGKTVEVAEEPKW